MQSLKQRSMSMCSIEGEKQSRAGQGQKGRYYVKQGRLSLRLICCRQGYFCSLSHSESPFLSQGPQLFYLYWSVSGCLWEWGPRGTAFYGALLMKGSSAERVQALAQQEAAGRWYKTLKETWAGINGDNHLRLAQDQGNYCLLRLQWVDVVWRTYTSPDLILKTNHNNNIIPPPPLFEFWELNLRASFMLEKCSSCVTSSFPWFYNEESEPQ